MRRWWLVLALLLSLGINVGILATLGVQRSRERQSPAPARGGGVPAGPELERVADRLELAGEARRRFLEIQRRFLAETGAERLRLDRARAELRREILSAHPDRARVEELLAAAAGSTAALERALVRNVLDSREVLDEEQERRFLRFVVSRLRRQRVRPGAMTPPAFNSRSSCHRLFPVGCQSFGRGSRVGNGGSCQLTWGLKLIMRTSGWKYRCELPSRSGSSRPCLDAGLPTRSPCR